MARRRSEVVVTSLLEVFLALAFVILAMAWFNVEQREGLQNSLEVEQDRNRRQGREYRQCQDSLDQFETRCDSLEEAVRRYQSEFAPLCRRGFFLTVEVIGPTRLSIEVNFDVLHHGANEVFQVPLTEFGATFEGVRAHSFEELDCRYAIQMIDSPTISKSDYKRIRGELERIFYVSERRPGG